jgi:hypothetical protein
MGPPALSEHSDFGGGLFERASCDSKRSLGRFRFLPRINPKNWSFWHSPGTETGVTLLWSSRMKAITGICLAPSQYWSWCLQIGDLQSAWPIFRQLVTALAKLGFPVAFAAVQHQGNDELGLPNITGISPVRLPSTECEKDRGRVDASGRAYAGSQRQIQTYVNDFPDVLNKTIADSLGSRFPDSARMRWVSPLKQADIHFTVGANGGSVNCFLFA